MEIEQKENQENPENKENEEEKNTEKQNETETLNKELEIEEASVEKNPIILNINQNFEIFERILIQLSKLFSTSLKENDILADELKVDKDLFIIKFCSENNFIDMESFYSKCYPEILRILVNSKRFGLMANDNIRTNTEKNLRLLNTEDRIEVLFYLVNSAFDLSSIKQQIKYENDLRNDLIRERNTLDYEM